MVRETLGLSLMKRIAPTMIIMRTLNKTLLYLFLGSSALLVGCQKHVPGVTPDESVINSVVFRMDPFQTLDDSPQTRTSVSGTSFYWAAKDTVGIYPDSGSQVFFELAAGAGASNAQFDGGGWAFKPSSVYYSYYPFIGDIYLNRNHIPVDYLGQKQIGSATDHIGPYDFMYTDPSSASDGMVDFSYHHLSCIIRPQLVGLPAGKYTKLAVTAPSAVFPEKGYYDLMAAAPAIVPTQYTNQLVIDLENFNVEAGGNYAVYLMSGPANVGNMELTISVLNEQRTEYQCKKTPSSHFLAGQNRGLTCNTFTAVPQSMGLIIDDWGDGGDIGGDAN